VKRPSHRRAEFLGRTGRTNSTVFDGKHSTCGLPPNTKLDIIVFAIIRLQLSPSAGAAFRQRLARKGHRVYYINANFGAAYAQCELEENLWQVTLPGAERLSIHLTDWQDDPAGLINCLDRLVRSCSIRDAVVIVDYPTGYTARYICVRSLVFVCGRTIWTISPAF
jgi:hypothetical protein